MRKKIATKAISHIGTMASRTLAGRSFFPVGTYRTTTSPRLVSSPDGMIENQDD